MTCDLPQIDFVGGSFTPVKDTYNYGEVVSFSCQKDYTLDGSNIISCSENEKFHPSPPTCVSKCFCSLSQHSPNVISRIWRRLFVTILSISVFQFNFLQRLNVTTLSLQRMVTCLIILHPLMDSRKQ